MAREELRLDHLALVGTRAGASHTFKQMRGVWRTGEFFFNSTQINQAIKIDPQFFADFTARRLFGGFSPLDTSAR